ncbi:MAG: DNA-binding response regulator, partial [Cyanobacteriota bacterium]|nr:DNA-binding response regulator [Cyanobacteriota bacterium]
MTNASSPRTRVLLVDDEPRLTELLRLELDVEGYEVSVAEDGASGLIKARSDPS